MASRMNSTNFAEQVAEMLPCPQHNRSVPGGALLVPLCLCDARDDIVALVEKVRREAIEECAKLVDIFLGRSAAETVRKRILALRIPEEP